MTYGDTSRARKKAGNPSTTNVSDNDVTQAVAYGDSMVNTFTGKDDWTSSDPEYESVQTASELFASSDIRDRFEDKEGKSKEHFERAMDICKGIRNGTQLIISTQSFRTYPLNPDATPYRSTTGSSNSVDDSDIS